MAARSLVLVLVLLSWISVSAAEEFMGKVIGVSDGDTLTVLREKTPVKLRLNGIDCPETGQPFGSRAKQETSELVFGKSVRVIPRDTDRYGRTVADVFLSDGRMLNQELVRSGYAWWYRKYAPNEGMLAKLGYCPSLSGKSKKSMADGGSMMTYHRVCINPQLRSRHRCLKTTMSSAVMTAPKPFDPGHSLRHWPRTAS